MKTLWLFLGTASCIDFYITSPYDVISWNAGEKAMVTWNILPGGPNVQGINVDLMDGDETTANVVSNIASNLPPSATSASWEVPMSIQPGRSYFVRVSSNDPNAYIYRFSHKFAIVGGKVCSKSTSSSSTAASTTSQVSTTTSTSASAPTSTAEIMTTASSRRSRSGASGNVLPSVLPFAVAGWIGLLLLI